MAAKARPGEHKDALLKMAQTWEGLAEERERRGRIASKETADTSRDISYGDNEPF